MDNKMEITMLLSRHQALEHSYIVARGYLWSVPLKDTLLSLLGVAFFPDLQNRTQSRKNTVFKLTDDLQSPVTSHIWNPSP